MADADTGQVIRMGLQPAELSQPGGGTVTEWARRSAGCRRGETLEITLWAERQETLLMEAVLKRPRPLPETDGGQLCCWGSSLGQLLTDRECALPGGRPAQDTPWLMIVRWDPQGTGGAAMPCGPSVELPTILRSWRERGKAVLLRNWFPVRGKGSHPNAKAG